MAGLIPRHKIKGVDLCGSRFYYYIIRSDLGCYMRSSDFTAGSDLSIHDLHPACQNGDHYFVNKSKKFYIIKGNSYRTVTDLSADERSAVFTLHPKCQGGDHYLAAFGWFYIIFQDRGTYRRTKDLSKDSHSEEFALLPNCKDGLYYWGEPKYYYFLKPTAEWGVEYYKGKDFQKYKSVSFFSLHPDVLNFLSGGLSITNGPAFGKWVNIKSVSNESPTPVTWQKRVTKKVGYNKEKMSQITQNWKIVTSGKITSGKLAGLISNQQFSYSAVDERSLVETEHQKGNEETVTEEQLTFELKPNECLNLWQYQLGLGSEPMLFCRDLKITDQQNPPQLPF